MPRTPDDRIQAQARAIRGMRQYRDKIATGEMTDDDVLRLAAERVLSIATPQGEAQSVMREYFGSYARDAGESMFADPWFIGDTEEADELVSHAHPIPVAYDVFAERSNGTVRRLVIDLAGTPL